MFQCVKQDEGWTQWSTECIEISEQGSKTQRSLLRGSNPCSYVAVKCAGPCKGI